MPVIKTGIFIKATSLITKVYTSISSKLLVLAFLLTRKIHILQSLRYSVIVYLHYIMLSLQRILAEGERFELSVLYF